MKDDKTLEAIVKRCQGECYIGIVGPVSSTGNNWNLLLSYDNNKIPKNTGKNSTKFWQNLLDEFL